MINADMRLYDYFTFGENNAYGQPQLSTQSAGAVLMAVNSITNTISDNVLYKNAMFLGLTTSSLLDDKCVIKYSENEKLKVLYIVPKGRYKQVFMAKL